MEIPLQPKKSLFQVFSCTEKKPKTEPPKKEQIIEPPKKKLRSEPTKIVIPKKEPLITLQKSTKPAVPSTTLITDKKRAHAIQIKFIELWGAKRKSHDYYPGPNPVSISRKTLEEMHSDEYVVAEKTDGVRYSLLLCRDHNNHPTCVMINRVCKKFEIQVLADSTFFDGTLFEGELAWEQEDKLIFWVFEAISIKGRSIRENNYISRFESIRHAFMDFIQSVEQTEHRASELASMGKIVSVGNAHHMIFKPKQAVMCRDMDNLWHSIPFMNHHNDGLIFTPIPDGIRFGTHWRQFKWKYEHTIDLELRAKKNTSGTWIYGLYYVVADFTVALADEQDKKTMDGEQSVAHFVNACNPGVEYDQRMVIFVLEENNIIRSLVKKVESDTQCFACIVECTGKFETPTKFLCSIKGIRPDKPDPNNRYTVRQTLLNIEECITYTEIRQTLLKEINVLVH